MLIKTDNRATWIHCNKCGDDFKMGRSCGCGGVVTHHLNSDATLILAEKGNAVIDTE